MVIYDLYVNRDYVRSYRTRKGVKRAFTNALNGGAADVAWTVAETNDGAAYARDWPHHPGCTTVARKFK